MAEILHCTGQERLGCLLDRSSGYLVVLGPHGSAGLLKPLCKGEAEMT